MPGMVAARGTVRLSGISIKSIIAGELLGALLVA
jgi:hypothetical protein